MDSLRTVKKEIKQKINKSPWLRMLFPLAMPRTPLAPALGARPPPRSCDTFVCVRAGTGGVGPACTLFGKNSDRPSEEAHEVVYYPRQASPLGMRRAAVGGLRRVLRCV